MIEAGLNADHVGIEPGDIVDEVEKVFFATAPAQGFDAFDAVVKGAQPVAGELAGGFLTGTFSHSIEMPSLIDLKQVFCKLFYNALISLQYILLILLESIL